MTEYSGELQQTLKSYDQLGQSPAAGDKVITLELDETMGMNVVQSLLDSRRSGIPGVVQGYVPGHGGDVWYVDHFAEAQAVYTTSEMAPVTD